jgi:hypothetical protein
MKNEFVSYEIALALKELGFDEPCFGYYLENEEWTPASYSMKGTIYPSNSDLLKDWVSSPLYQQAFRWFREKYGLFSEIQPYLIIGTRWRYTITNRNNSSGLPHKEGFETYEEAEQACLDKLIEIIKNNAHI